MILPTGNSFWSYNTSKHQLTSTVLQHKLTATDGGPVLMTESNSSFIKSDSFDETNRLQSSALAAQISSSTRYNFFCSVFSLSLLYNKFSLKYSHKHIQQPAVNCCAQNVCKIHDKSVLCFTFCSNKYSY